MRVPRSLKDLYLATRATQVQLSQQLGKSAVPSEIADGIGVSTSKVIEALQAGKAYQCSSLDEVLNSEDTSATRHTFFGKPDSQIGLIEDCEVLRPLLAQLAPRQRAILALRFFYHQTQNEIAAQLGISQVHVSRLLRRTLASLHEGMTNL